MAMFQYTAKNSTSGQILRGTMDVPTRDEVIAFVRKNRMILVSVREAPTQLRIPLPGSGIKTRDVVIFHSGYDDGRPKPYRPYGDYYTVDRRTWLPLRKEYLENNFTPPRLVSILSADYDVPLPPIYGPSADEAPG